MMGINKIRPLTISKFKFYWRHIKYTNNPNKWKATKKKKVRREGQVKQSSGEQVFLGWKRVMCRISIWKIKGEEGSQERNMIKRKVMETESQRYKEWGKKGYKGKDSWRQLLRDQSCLLRNYLETIKTPDALVWSDAVKT